MCERLSEMIASEGFSSYQTLNAKQQRKIVVLLRLDLHVRDHPWKVLSACGPDYTSCGHRLSFRIRLFTVVWRYST